MAIKLGINGFGRIGHVVFRIITERADEFELCGINTRAADLDYIVYSIKYDSVFGRFNGTVEKGEDCIIVNGKKIRIFGEDTPSNTKWSECGAEYIIECTGVFNTTEKASLHFEGGAKKVIITAPAKDKETPTFVYGVNSNTYKPEMKVISNASCTTNCLAPLVKVIHENFGIEQGLMSTIHAATAKQNPVDMKGKDLRKARSVFGNIIPTTTGAAKAVSKVIPEMEGKLTGMSFRVPCNDVSLVDLTLRLVNSTTYEDICKALKEASQTYMKGIINYCEDEIVSCDVVGDPCSCIFDSKASLMLDGTFVKLLAWYDNEYGYSSMVMNMVKYMAETDAKDVK